jgi:hypothetical protein
MELALFVLQCIVQSVQVLVGSVIFWWVGKKFNNE